jgi:hypothetical protein
MNDKCSQCSRQLHSYASKLISLQDSSVLLCTNTSAMSLEEADKPWCADVNDFDLKLWRYWTDG